MSNQDKKQTAEVMMSEMTGGNYMVRIQNENGNMVEVILTPEAFAKAVTGKLAKGYLTEDFQTNK